MYMYGHIDGQRKFVGICLCSICVKASAIDLRGPKADRATDGGGASAIVGGAPGLFAQEKTRQLGNST